MFNKIKRDVIEKLKLWPGFSTIMHTFTSDPNCEIYLAGGFIRNVILNHNRHAKDIDFFISTNNINDKIKELEAYGEIHHTPYGAPRWYPHGSSTYADLIPIENFVPGLWKCNDIIDVLNQFDFTFNAMALDLRKLIFYNPQNGYRDAKNHILKMVRFDYPAGPFLAGENLDRNVILWFRAVHYISELNTLAEPITLGWIKKHACYIDFRHRFSELFFEPNLNCLKSLYE